MAYRKQNYYDIDDILAEAQVSPLLFPRALYLSFAGVHVSLGERAEVMYGVRLCLADHVYL